MDQEIKNEFGKMGGEIGGLKSEIGGMKGEIGGLKSEIGGMKGEIGGLKGEMSKMSSEFEKLVIMIKKGFDKTATKQELKVCKKELRAEINKNKLELKDFIENKLADQKGDLILLARKEDKKLLRLAGILYGRKVINKSEVEKLSSMEPFPRIMA